jgi:3-oxo-5alpha-steroid 4-dehydrogenase
MAQCGETRARGGDGAYDVIVVGFGAAGACAAIEAAEQGARVLLIDRFFGGGATARSGGIVYLGGGTALQKAAGYDDDPEQMFRYLQYEGGGAHDEPTLRAFCNESLTSLAFLETLGVPFPPSRDTPRTSYPDDDCTLYFSGNELAPPYSEGARPAPRGHRVLGKGITGDVLFRHLRAGVKQRSIDVWLCSEARELVVTPPLGGFGVIGACFDSAATARSSTAGSPAGRVAGWRSSASGTAASCGCARAAPLCSAPGASSSTRR